MLLPITVALLALQVISQLEALQPVINAGLAPMDVPLAGVTILETAHLV